MSKYWMFGDSAGIEFNGTNTPIVISSQANGRGSSVSIADTNGFLLFYATTNGDNYRTVPMNKFNDTLFNGVDITGRNLYNDLTIVPFPKHPNQFILFHVSVSPFNDTLYYSIIDMQCNNTQGCVIAKNIPFDIYRSGDCLTAIKHGNGRDWWLISKYSDVNTPMNNRFFVYLVDSNGIQLQSTQDFNDATDGDFQKIIIHPNGNKFMLINILGYMAEFNFDRCKGIISLSKSIYPEIPSPWCCRYFWEGAYSKSGDVFYASTTGINSQFSQGYLLQYNLLDSNPTLKVDTLDTFDTPIGTGAVRLAPDNKIYFSRAYESPNAWSYPYPDSMRNYINENLSVINEPDSLGAACDYQPFSFYLGGKRTYYGLPNNPNYELGPLVGSPCDTLSANSPPAPQRGEQKLYTTYIAGWEKLFINASGLKGKQLTATIYDGRGSLMFEVQSLKSNAGYFTLDVDCIGWSDGLYVVHLQTEKEVLSKKFVKE
nr:T9SS type A sorting domain-containing protein [Bacteroidota bacterium]